MKERRLGPRDDSAVYEEAQRVAQAKEVHSQRLVVFEYVRARFLWELGPGIAWAAYFDDEFQTMIEQARELPVDATPEYIEGEKLNAMWWCTGQRMKLQWEAR